MNSCSLFRSVGGIKIRDASSKNALQDTCAQQRIRSACAITVWPESHWSYFLLPRTQGFFKRRTKTDNTAQMAQVVLSLRWAHMSEGTFSDVATHTFNIGHIRRIGQVIVAVNPVTSFKFSFETYCLSIFSPLLTVLWYQLQYIRLAKIRPKD